MVEVFRPWHAVAKSANLLEKNTLKTELATELAHAASGLKSEEKDSKSLVFNLHSSLEIFFFIERRTAVLRADLCCDNRNPADKHPLVSVARSARSVVHSIQPDCLWTSVPRRSELPTPGFLLEADPQGWRSSVSFRSGKRSETTCLSFGFFGFWPQRFSWSPLLALGVDFVLEVLHETGKLTYTLHFAKTPEEKPRL